MDAMNATVQTDLAVGALLSSTVPGNLEILGPELGSAEPVAVLDQSLPAEDERDTDRPGARALHPRRIRDAGATGGLRLNVRG